MVDEAAIILELSSTLESSSYDSRQPWCRRAHRVRTRSAPEVEALRPCALGRQAKKKRSHRNHPGSEPAAHSGSGSGQDGAHGAVSVWLLSWECSGHGG